MVATVAIGESTKAGSADRLSPQVKDLLEIGSGDIHTACGALCSARTPQPSQNLVEPSWNPGVCPFPNLTSGPPRTPEPIWAETPSCWGIKKALVLTTQDLAQAANFRKQPQPLKTKKSTIFITQGKSMGRIQPVSGNAKLLLFSSKHFTQLLGERKKWPLDSSRCSSTGPRVPPELSSPGPLAALPRRWCPEPASAARSG